MPFAFDWLGRQYSVDLDDENRILMFDPATMEDFSLPQNLKSFHNYDLVEDRDSVLSEEYFGDVIRFLKNSKC